MKLRISDEELIFARDKLNHSLTTTIIFGVDVYDLILDLKEARDELKKIEKIDRCNPKTIQQMTDDGEFEEVEFKWNGESWDIVDKDISDTIKAGIKWLKDQTKG